MTEKEQQNIKVIAGHTESIKNQIKDLYNFINDMTAISEYGKKGFTTINLDLVLRDVRNGLASMSQSVEVIATTTQELQAPETEEEK